MRKEKKRELLKKRKKERRDKLKKINNYNY